MAAPVHVESLEALGELRAAIDKGSDELSAAASDAALAVAQAREWIEERHSSARRGLDMAQEASLEARRDVATAAADLAEAEASDDDEDGYAAMAARDALAGAEAALERAQQAEQRAERHAELAQGWNARLNGELRRLSDRALATSAHASDRFAAASGLLDRKLSQLGGYARQDRASSATGAAAARAPWSLDGWLCGSELAAGRRDPSALRARFALDRDELESFTRFLAERDTGFRAELQRQRAYLRQTQGDGDVHLAFAHARTRLSGLWAERMTEYALAPLAREVQAQRSTLTDDGQRTVTDFVLRGMTAPLILGRGQGRFVPAGGSLAVEVKARKPEALLSGREQLLTQVDGHARESASLVLVSRDIHDLPEDEEQELREDLRLHGSGMLAALPDKDTIDDLCWQAVLGKGDAR